MYRKTLSRSILMKVAKPGSNNRIGYNIYRHINLQETSKDYLYTQGFRTFPSTQILLRVILKTRNYTQQYKISEGLLRKTQYKWRECDYECENFSDVFPDFDTTVCEHQNFQKPAVPESLTRFIKTLYSETTVKFVKYCMNKTGRTSSDFSRLMILLLFFELPTKTAKQEIII